MKAEVLFSEWRPFGFWKRGVEMLSIVDERLKGTIPEARREDVFEGGIHKFRAIRVHVTLQTTPRARWGVVKDPQSGAGGFKGKPG